MSGRMRAFLAATATVVLSLACWTSLARRGPDTDLLSLLPASEMLPEADVAARKLMELAGNRIIILIESGDAAAAGEAADGIARDLAGTRALASAQARFPKPDLSQLRRMVAVSHDRLPAGDGPLLGRLDSRMGSPFPDPMAEPLPADPFGIAADWMRAIPWPAAGMTWEDGFLRTRQGGREGVLVVANFRSPEPSLNEQAEVVLAAEQAIENARARHGDLAVSRIGGAFHATAAQASARKDVDLIGIGSLAGILLLMLGVFRSPRMLALCLSSVAVGMAAGTAATLGTFGEIHLLTLVFGVSLLGEAADYSIQLTTARLSRTHDPDWSRAVTPGLTMALGTSLLGYAAILLIPLPLVRQIGVFAFVGISAAYLCVRLVGPSLVGVKAPGRVPLVFGRAARMLEHIGGRVRTRHRAAAAGLAAAGLAWTAWIPSNDDIRSLVSRPSELSAGEERMATIAGSRPSTTFILLRPPTSDDENCLRLGERALSRLAELRKAGVVEDWQSLAQVAPSAESQAANMAAFAKAWESEGLELSSAMGEMGLPTERPDTPRLDIQEMLALDILTPFRALRVESERGIAHVMRLSGEVDSRRLSSGLSDIEGAHVVDRVGAISDALGELRRWGPAWIALALGLSLGLLGIRHGIRGGLRLLFPTTLGLCWACPLAHLAGVPVSIFSLLALTLVLGVGLNYGIFLVEGGLRDGAALAGVLASAATTLISFGLLAFAEMPALSWLGTTLAIGILVSLAASPMALAPRRS